MLANRVTAELLRVVFQASCSRPVRSRSISTPSVSSAMAGSAFVKLLCGDRSVVRPKRTSRRCWQSCARSRMQSSGCSVCCGKQWQQAAEVSSCADLTHSTLTLYLASCLLPSLLQGGVQCLARTTERVGVCQVRATTGPPSFRYQTRAPSWSEKHHPSQSSSRRACSTPRGMHEPRRKEENVAESADVVYPMHALPISHVSLACNSPIDRLPAACTRLTC